MKGNAVRWRNFILHSWDDHHSCHKELWWTHFYSRVDAYGTNSFEIVEASGHPMPRHHLKERGDEARLQSLQDSTGSKRWEGGFVVRQTSDILRLHKTSSQYAQRWNWALLYLLLVLALALLDQPSVGKHFDIGNIEVVTHLAKGPHPCSEGIPLQRSHVHQI